MFSGVAYCGLFHNLEGSVLLDTANVDVKQFYETLSSRDGFLLLLARRNLCLCNPLAGSCRFLPTAAFGAQSTWKYVLVTGGDSVVWVLAFRRETYVKNGMIYRLFSTATGEWGPVKTSLKFFDKGFQRVDMGGGPDDVVVCGSSVYCLIWLHTNWQCRRCVFAIDVHTERSWTTELPDKYAAYIWNNYWIVLATSGDGRLSVISPLVDNPIEVWVLGGDRGDEWTLQRTINLHNLIPSCPTTEGNVSFMLRAFCPRSGFLFGDLDNKELLIDVNTGSIRLTGRMGFGRINMYPIEMDWSTYISKMKYF